MSGAVKLKTTKNLVEVITNSKLPLLEATESVSPGKAIEDTVEIGVIVKVKVHKGCSTTADGTTVVAISAKTIGDVEASESGLDHAALNGLTHPL